MLEEELLTASQRGGAGNEHREKYGGHSKSPSRERLSDKVKHLLHKDKDHKHEESPLQNQSTPS